MRLAITLFLSLSVALLGTAAVGAANHVDAGAISGQVTGPHGNAVADAVVEVEIHTRNGHVFKARTHTNDRGHFSFPRVAPGRGVIQAGKHRIGRDRQRILVHPGEHVRVHLELHS